MAVDRQFGLAATLVFKDKGATAAMNKIGAKADTLRAKFAGVGKGMSQMQRGVSQLALGFAPVTLGLGAIIRKGAQFEQSIATLRSKMLNQFDPALEGVAKTLGATTAFSATQAADAMTLLAQSGLNSKEIMQAVPSVLDAAAAENIGLAEAADIVASNMKSFSLSAGEAARIAGVLAVASTKTNTTMLSLQEGLKLAAPAANLVGASLQDTSAILGSLANIGLKGTLAGTAFRAALTKLSNPTKQVKEGLKQLGVPLSKIQKDLKTGNVVGAFQSLTGPLSKISDGGKRAAIAMQIFGLRGAGVATAIKQAGQKGFSRFQETLEAIRRETGKTAEEMKKIQLKTLTGQFKLFRSALEGVSLEVFGLIAGKTSGAVNTLTKRIGQLALALQIVRGQKIIDPKVQKQVKEIPPVIFDIAAGIKDAFTEVKSIFSTVIGSIQSVGKTLGFEMGGRGPREITKLITKFLVLGGAIAPIGLALLGVGKIAGGVFNTIAGGARLAFGTLRGGLGVAGKLFGKIPGLGKVGKAASAVENITASPVRVVNFGEFGGFGGGASDPRQLSLFNQETKKGVGRLARLRVGLANLVGKSTRFGALLNSSAFTVAKSGSKLARVLGGAGKLGLVGAAGAAGFALGTFLDRTLGISDKLSSLARNVVDRVTGAGAARERRLGEFKKSTALANAKAMAQQLATLSQGGVRSVGGINGKRENLTREFAEQRISSFLRDKQGFSQAEVLQTLRNLNSTLNGIRRVSASQKAQEFFAAANPANQFIRPQFKPAKDALVNTGGFLPVSAGDVVIDRGSLAGAVTSQLRGGLANQVRGTGDPGKVTPTPQRPQTVRIEVPLMLDARQVALAVAEVRLDDMERSGGNLQPGQRSALLQRGFTGEI